MFTNFISMLSLQLFGEGAGGAAGAAGDGGTAQGQGVTAGAASQQTGVTAPTPEVQKTDAADLNAEFEALIKGKYKEQYDSRMQSTIQNRLKGHKETVEKYNSLAPTLEILGKKYGVDASDIKALNEAIEADDSYFEQDALEAGMSVEQFKEFRKIQRENSELRRQMQERQTQENANRIMAGWMDQGEKVKAIYPTFDLKAEMQNPKFVDLLKSNIDVRTAYEVIHKDDIIRGAMQFTAQTVESKIAQGIASGSRPAENGTGSGSPALVKSDVSKLSKAQREDYIRRAARGEKISF
jgi:hypothetical protein